MWKYVALLLCLSEYSVAGPVGITKRNVAIGQQKANDDAAVSSVVPNSDEMLLMSSLTLPSNATSIRADITDNFSCDNKSYGYYADVDNDCQIFHVCLPVTYADGKENTFRWSFICPEETIFSQESFTCMRPEDMVSSCEESFKYYQLNDNFGNVEQEMDKETNEEPAMAAENPAMEAEPEPEITIPVKVQKPNRRKPGVSYAGQKKPGSSHPLRKVPQGQMPLNTNAIPEQTTTVKETGKPLDNEEQEELEREEEVKPVVNKFSRRPVASMSNSFKDKMQNVKPENVNAIRSDLYNQKRKRPVMFNKKPIEEEMAKQPELAVQEVSFVHNNEEPQEAPQVFVPVAEDKVDIEPAKDESLASQSNFSQMESDMSNTNTDTQASDSEIQASGAHEVVVKTEENVEEEANAKPADEPIEIPEQPLVLEAFEEIPAVVMEVEEHAALPNSNEEMPKPAEMPEEPRQTMNEETQEIPKAEEHVTPQETDGDLNMHNTEDNQNAQENMPVSEEVQSGEGVKNVEVPLSLENVEESHTADAIVPAVEPQSLEAVETEKDPQDEETLAIEASQASEPNAEETQMSEGNMPVEETAMGQETEMVKDNIQAVQHAQEQTEEETQTSLKTQEEEVKNEEEVSSVIESQKSDEPVFSQESQLFETNKPQATNEESMEKEMTPSKTEVMAEEIPAEQSIVKGSEATPEETPEVSEVLAEETMPVNSESEAEHSTYTGPAIFEENSDEAAAAAPSQTIEEMEDEKPAEAPESMPVTDEMAQQDPIVQQMFEETIDEDKKHTIGGFKPVDPAMAAEAEQLIADFINTLRKNEFVNETPGMPMQVAAMEEQLPESVEDTAANNPELSKSAEELLTGSEGQAEVLQEQQSEEILNQPEIVEAHTSSEETKNEETQTDSKPSEEEIKSEEPAVSEELTKTEEKAEEESPKEEANPSSVPSMSSLQQDSYQIPVQVITAPLEDMSQYEANEHQPESNAISVDLPKKSDEKLETEAEQSAVLMEGYKPLSIDDIVEMVKERLDQMPKDKLETPMQLEQVLGDVHANKEQVNEEVPQAINEPSEEAPKSEEEIILPIYHRTSDIEAPLPEASLPLSDTVAEEPLDLQEKSGRFIKSHKVLSPKVDSRKRRFFFRADVS